MIGDKFILGKIEESTISAEALHCINHNLHARTVGINTNVIGWMY